MKILAGNVLTRESQPVDSDTVRFVTDDNRTMFEVRVVSENSIEVRGVETCRVDGVLYSESLNVQPRAANHVIIQPKVY